MELFTFSTYVLDTCSENYWQPTIRIKKSIPGIAETERRPNISALPLTRREELSSHPAPAAAFPAGRMMPVVAGWPNESILARLRTARSKMLDQNTLYDFISVSSQLG